MKAHNPFERWVCESFGSMRTLALATEIPYWRICRYSQGQKSALSDTQVESIKAACLESRGPVPVPDVTWSAGE